MRTIVHRLSLLAPAVFLLAGCSWFVSKPLPICVTDERSKPVRGDVVDVFAVRSENELLRQTVTPVDEYFSTLGRASRPSVVWRCYLDDGSRQILWDDSWEMRTWRRSEADRAIAVTMRPPRTTTDSADSRRTTFPLAKKDYPRGTQSLILHVTDAGPAVEASRTKLIKPKKK